MTISNIDVGLSANVEAIFSATRPEPGWVSFHLAVPDAMLREKRDDLPEVETISEKLFLLGRILQKAGL